MAIPALGINGLLPPFDISDPTGRGNRSPYNCDPLDVCIAFGTSVERIQVLRGWFNLRDELRNCIVQPGGFQMLDGSFCSDKRVPGDIDVVTYIVSKHEPILAARVSDPVDQLYQPNSKPNFKVDHYIVTMDDAPEDLIIEHSYWFSLFGHERNGTWKGVLTVPLYTADNDLAAKNYLHGVII